MGSVPRNSSRLMNRSSVASSCSLMNCIASRVVIARDRTAGRPRAPRVPACNARARWRDQSDVHLLYDPWRSTCRSLSRAPARSRSRSPSWPGFLLLARTRWRPSGALYTQTNDPARQRRAAVRPRAGRLAHPRGHVRHRRRRPRRASAGARAPSSSAATAATCTRSTPAPTASRSSAPATDPADRHRLLARRRAGERRRAPRPRLRPQLGRDAERRRLPAPVRRLAEADPGGTRELAPGADGAAQVSVTPDGRSLVVSERVSNRLETLPLDRFGRPGAPVVTASSGAVPFGFGITRHGTIVVSEAGASTVSSYRARRGGALAHGHRLAARRPGRRLLGRRLAERPLRLHRQRRRRHQRLRGRA